MRTILYLSLFVLLFTYAWAQVYDGDIGHHLKAGEWMLAYGKILDRDIFSYTAYGNSWLNHSWLAEIILYYIYSLVGINGLIFFKIIIILLAYGILVRACHIVTGRNDLISDIPIAILFIMSVLSASIRFMVRPLVFTYLGVALSTYLYMKACSIPDKTGASIKYLFFIPLLLMFWVNLHAEFMLGVIMLAVFYAYTIAVLFVKRILKKKILYSPGYYVKVHLVLILSIGALCINPYGFKLFVHPVALTTSDLFMTRISEWLPSIHPTFRECSSVKIFYWFLGIGLLSFILNFKKRNTLFFLFFVTLGLMSLSAIRFMPYFAMIGVPIAAGNLNHITKFFSGKRWSFSLKKLITVGIIIFSIFLIKERIQYTEFGLGLSEKICYPLDAGEFLNRAGVKGNVFNMVDFGGYLILYHPDRPVCADGRLDVYGEDTYRDFLNPSEEIFQKYNINYTFLSYRHPVTRGFLYRNEDWPLVYWDDTALIHLKKTEKNMDIIDRYAYRYLNPLTGSYTFLEKAAPELKARVQEEIHRALRVSPDSIRVHVILGDIYVELKDYRNAVQAYEEAIRLGKRYNTAYMVKIYHNLGKLYHNFQEYPKAEGYYRKVIKMASPGRTTYNQALEDWGQLAYARGKKKRAFKFIKKAVKYKKRFKGSPFSTYPVTLAKLAILYEEFGKKDKALLAWEEVYETGGRDSRQQAYEHLMSLRGGS